MRMFFRAKDIHIFGSFFCKGTYCGYQISRNVSKKLGNAGANYYDVLGLKPNATQSEIKSAYYQLSKLYHPDYSKCPQNYSRFLEVKEAYEVLGNLQKKHKYDEGIYNGNTSRTDSTNTAKDKETENHTEAFRKSFHSIHNRPLRTASGLTNDKFYRQIYNLRTRRRKQHDRRLLLLILVYGYSIMLFLSIVSGNR